MYTHFLEICSVHFRFLFLFMQNDKFTRRVRLASIDRIESFWYESSLFWKSLYFFVIMVWLTFFFYTTSHWRNGTYFQMLHQIRTIDYPLYAWIPLNSISKLVWFSHFFRKLCRADNKALWSKYPSSYRRVHSRIRLPTSSDNGAKNITFHF